MLNIDVQTWSSIGYMVSTAAFAVTAVLAVRGDTEIDLLGATVLGLITAIGGGTVRDVVLDVPVFWLQDLSYVWVAIVASLLAFYGRRLFTRSHVQSLMLYLDGFGVSLFSIQSVGHVWDLGQGLPAAPVIMGMITGIGGGLIRDVLAGRVTLLLRPELYATPVLLGCTVLTVILAYLPEYREAGTVICLVGTFAIRAAAIHWKLTLPYFATMKGDKPASKMQSIISYWKKERSKKNTE